MIVDSSVLVAVLLRQPGHEALIDKISVADPVGVGAPTLAETGLVLAARLGITGKALLARFVEEAGITVARFGPEHWPIAVDAFIRYGKGRHPAGLNFGDCLTYAIARLAQAPLLYVGDDFARTDLQLA